MCHVSWILDKRVYKITQIAGPEAVIIPPVMDGKFQYREGKFAKSTRHSTFLCTACGPSSPT